MRVCKQALEPARSVAASRRTPWRAALRSFLRSRERARAHSSSPCRSPRRASHARHAQAAAVRPQQSVRWLPIAVATVRAAARLVPPPARDFDVLPAWFRALELIASDEWLVEYSAAQQAGLALARHVHATARVGADGSAGGGGGGLSSVLFDQRPAAHFAPAGAGGGGGAAASAGLRLAARVLLALLAKVQHDKANRLTGGAARPLVLTDGSADSRAHVLALQRSATADAYRAAPRAFFVPLDAMLARACSIAEWRTHTLGTLFPMAVYLTRA